ncbi:MAG: cold shock domain-containing protein [Chloroflexia bacterium]|nr:cold shock domain-containing protein [Chloroflexia bacterium]
MAKSGDTFNKKEVRNKKEKKRKEKEKRKLAKKEEGKKNSFDDMIAYVDENGMITSTPPDLSKKEEINAEDIVIGVPTREKEPEDLIRTGTVDFFDSSKFGFIKDAKTKESIFVHINNVKAESLKEGNLVTFETEMGTKGPVAINVKLSK